MDIERYVRTVDPDPVHEEEISVSYVYSDDISTFNQGDKIKVRVHAINYTGAQRLLRSSIGLWLPGIDYSLAGRVR